MTARVRKVLVWSGMFVLAFAGGSWLGGFAVSGLAGGDNRLTDAAANEAQDFWDRLSAERQARAEVPNEPVSSIAYIEPEHVCEGCDAGETRYRQFAENLQLYYGGDEPPVEAAPIPAIESGMSLASSAMRRTRLPEPGALPQQLPRLQGPVSAAPVPSATPQR